MQNEGSRCGERVVSSKVRGYSKFDYGRIEEKIARAVAGSVKSGADFFFLFGRKRGRRYNDEA